jgi:hypothetical protein
MNHARALEAPAGGRSTARGAAEPETAAHSRPERFLYMLRVIKPTSPLLADSFLRVPRDRLKRSICWPTRHLSRATSCGSCSAGRRCLALVGNAQRKRHRDAPGHVRGRRRNSLLGTATAKARPNGAAVVVPHPHVAPLGEISVSGWREGGPWIAIGMTLLRGRTL